MLYSFNLKRKVGNDSLEQYFDKVDYLKKICYIQGEVELIAIAIRVVRFAVSLAQQQKIRQI